MSATFTVCYLDENGEAVAHTPGCKDIARLVRRTDTGTITLTVTSKTDLCEQLSASIVGSLEDALEEVGSYAGLWDAHPAGCCRKAYSALPEGTPRFTVIDRSLSTGDELRDAILAIGEAHLLWARAPHPVAMGVDDPEFQYHLGVLNAAADVAVAL